MADEFTPEVPGQVYKKFLEELGNDLEIPKETLEKLQRIILEKKNLSEGTIRDALFSPNQKA